MRAGMTSWGLPRTARAAALAAILAGGAGACEHTGSLEPPSPRTAPAASVESREMEALLTAVQRETRAQGPADAAREQLIAALFAAAWEPAPHGRGTERPASAVPAHVEQAFSRMRSSPGDPSAAASILQELMDRDSRTP
jgi:hypothetical protein